IEENLVQYSHMNISNFAQLEIDLDNNQLIVGSREYIYRLSLHDLSLLEMYAWPGNDDSRLRCEVALWKYCSNYVLVVKKRDKDLLVCGTNYLNVTCDYRNPTSLTAIVNSVHGVGLIPFRPEQQSAMMVTADQILYSASLADKYSNYGMLLKYPTTTHEEFLISSPRDMFWFHFPSFVGFLELGDHVYVFFRETSVECAGCGERIVSRIGRVCKNETITNKHSKLNVFSTFAKARLNCSLPGDVPFYFDQIQSVYLEPEEQLIYATFTAPPMLGSAICVYNTSSIEKTFQGSYKYRKDVGCNWFKVDSKYNKACTEPPPSTNEQRHDAVNYILMLNEVQPTLIGPLVMCELDRWSIIEVHRVPTASDNRQTVMFVASTKGYIKKFMVHPAGQSACLVEFIRLLRSGQQKPILQMKHSPSKNALYVALEGRVLKIPTSRCDRFLSKTACQSAQDPYCGWDTVSASCTKETTGRDATTWQQSITQCPVLDYPAFKPSNPSDKPSDPNDKPSDGPSGKSPGPSDEPSDPSDQNKACQLKPAPDYVRPRHCDELSKQNRCKTGRSNKCTVSSGNDAHEWNEQQLHIQFRKRCTPMKGATIAHSVQEKMHANERVKATVQPRYSHCTTMTQSLYNHGAATVQPLCNRGKNHCTATVQLLYIHCTATVHSLYSLGTVTAQPLYNHGKNHCTATVKSLYTLVIYLTEQYCMA
ncbi:Semaphorin-5B, partial [Bulinus truncatus]